MAEHVLIVEDEADLNTMISDFLVSRGFETASVYDGPAAVRAVFEDPPDIVVLDLNLPGLAGLDVARTIVSQTSIPIVVTTARGEEEDRLAGFLSGADDYLVKPFSLPELTLRIQAVLRRTAGTIRSEGQASPRRVLRIGGLRVDPDRREVYVDDRRVSLTALQFDLLYLLSSAPGRVFSRARILEAVQGSRFEGYERTIDVHVKNIRKRIEEDPARPRRLVTVRGVGYRLEDR